MKFLDTWTLDKIEAKQMVSRQNGNKTGRLQKMMDEWRIDAGQKDAVGLKDVKRRMEWIEGCRRTERCSRKERQKNAAGQKDVNRMQQDRRTKQDTMMQHDRRMQKDRNMQ